MSLAAVLGKEQIYNPERSKFEKLYIAMFGIPILGLRIRARNIFSLIPEGRRYSQILDAGSGPGVFSFALARRFASSHVVGIDILDTEIRNCQRMAEAVGINNVEFKVGSILDLPDTDRFDLVLSVDMLEHIEDDIGALREMHKSMVKGGVLVVHVPALYRRYPVWKKSLNFDVPTHVRTGYELHELQEKLKTAGFTIRESGFTYGFWETLANNLSYMITGARMKNKLLYAVAFPFLVGIAALGAKARPKQLGAGVYAVAEKSQ